MALTLLLLLMLLLLLLLLLLDSLPGRAQFAQTLESVVSQIKPILCAHPACKFQQLASQPLGVVRLKD